MGSCFSTQDKKDTKGKRQSVHGRRSPKTTHAEGDQEPNLEEAINKQDKCKESLEEEIDGLQQQLEETKDERGKRSIERRLSNKRRRLKNVNTVIKQLEKAYEESTQHEVQKGRSLIRQCTCMTTQARLQVEAFEDGIAQTQL